MTNTRRNPRPLAIVASVAWITSSMSALAPATAGRKLAWRRVTRLSALLCMTTLLAVLSVAQSVTAQGARVITKKYEAASVRAKPGLQCELHPRGNPAARGIPLATDYDGYARFYAIRVRKGAAGQWLTLSCKNSKEKAFSYRVNLASAQTFVARPLNLAKAPGKNRPALKGNPLVPTQAQLIQEGYGLRPNFKSSPAAYARWLAAARIRGRMLYAKNPDLQPNPKKPPLHSDTVTSQPGTLWTGTTINGAQSYGAVEGNFNVPAAIPGGDGTSSTSITIWNGVGGFNACRCGLVQSGVGLRTTSTTATYGSWREYCCGDGISNAYGGNFRPNPGDKIYEQNWFCDAAGNINVDGGYGCSYLVDLTTHAVLDCTSARGSPCPSVPALAGWTFGSSAEFIIEDDSPQINPKNTFTAFTDFSPTVAMTGSAYSTQTNRFSQNIENDASLYVFTDFTHTTSHIVVGTTSPSGTNAGPSATVFRMEATQPSYPLYCQGPLSTPTAQVPTPTTVFKWASTGAHTEPPGPGECAWADRPPRGSEVHPGDTGIIYGYLNQVANLAAGKYAEIDVYRDPVFDNDLNVTKIIGFVSPPF